MTTIAVTGHMGLTVHSIPLVHTVLNEMHKASPCTSCGRTAPPTRAEHCTIALHSTQETGEGDLEQALMKGESALDGDRQSVPSLIMTSRELAAEMKRHYAPEPTPHEYLARLYTLGQSGFLPQWRRSSELTCQRRRACRHVRLRHLPAQFHGTAIPQA